MHLHGAAHPLHTRGWMLGATFVWQRSTTAVSTKPTAAAEPTTVTAAPATIPTVLASSTFYPALATTAAIATTLLPGVRNRGDVRPCWLCLCCARHRRNPDVSQALPSHGDQVLCCNLLETCGRRSLRRPAQRATRHVGHTRVVEAGRAAPYSTRSGHRPPAYRRRCWQPDAQWLYRIVPTASLPPIGSGHAALSASPTPGLPDLLKPRPRPRSTVHIRLHTVREPPPPPVRLAPPPASATLPAAAAPAPTGTA